MTTSITNEVIHPSISSLAQLVVFQLSVLHQNVQKFPGLILCGRDQTHSQMHAKLVHLQNDGNSRYDFLPFLAKGVIL